MENIDTWFSIIASVLGIVATVTSWRNQRKIKEIRSLLSIASNNKQISKGKGSVQQNGSLNINGVNTNGEHKAARKR
ncbi:hypothetical protein ACGIJG_09425 [Lacticaseibacillus rhamnosus]|uniref:hypothetical protein n=1 Tax=Lacticaseibacillus rhamnosus TaxID=47715 RepID=UPI0022DF1A2D|nr:hypothetical protein [Lacticaseibacillus rhamnosus]